MKLHVNFWPKLVLTTYLFAWFILTATLATAQQNEVALTVGGYFPNHVQARSDKVFAIVGNLSHRIDHVGPAAFYLELPIAHSFDSRVSATSIFPGQFFITRSYSALFVTPGLKVKFIPGADLSPYLSIGGGWAHFSRQRSNSTIVNLPVSSQTNTSAFDVGGGLDWKISSLMSLRGELRNFYSGAPELIHGLESRENQIIASGGIVLRF